MNFAFMKPFSSIKVFYQLCEEAEEFVLYKPDISVMLARKSIEYVVRLLHASLIRRDDRSLTVFEILSSRDLQMYLDNPILLHTMHQIRQKGNLAIHECSMTQNDAKKVMEQLHFVAGELCIFLGLISDYPPFYPNYRTKDIHKKPMVIACLNDDIPQIDQAIIKSFQHCFENKRHYSNLRKKQQDIVDVHINMQTMKKSQTIDSAANSRMAFRMIAEWIQNQLPEAKISLDRHLLQIIIKKKDNKRICVAVKTGHPMLGSKNEDGEWKILFGVDFVAYTHIVIAEKPVIEQFHIFSREEFLSMWNDLGLIHHKVSSNAHKQLKKLLGNNETISVEKYADTLAVQSFMNSNKKYPLFLAACKEHPLICEGGMEKMIQSRFKERT